MDQDNGQNATSFDMDALSFALVGRTISAVKGEGHGEIIWGSANGRLTVPFTGALAIELHDGTKLSLPGGTSILFALPPLVGLRRGKQATQEGP